MLKTKVHFVPVCQQHFVSHTEKHFGPIDGRMIWTEKQIGAAVREARERLGLTRPQVGERLNMDQESVKKMETGERTKQWIRVSEVARALETTPNDLLGFPVVDLESLETALQPILAAFGHDPEDAESIARILLEAVEDARSLQGDEPPEVRFRHAGEIAAARFRRQKL